MEHQLHDLGQGEGLVAQYTGKGDELAPAHVGRVVYHVVVAHIGGAYPVEGAVGIGLAYGEPHEVERLVGRYGAVGRLEVEGEEGGLCLFERQLRVARLQGVVGVGRRYA